MPKRRRNLFPKVQNKIPPPAYNQNKTKTRGEPGLASSMAQSVVMGAGLGAGSEIGHQVVGSVLSSSEKKHVNVDNECQKVQKQLVQCLEVSDNCDFLIQHMRYICADQK